MVDVRTTMVAVQGVVRNGRNMMLPVLILWVLPVRVDGLATLTFSLFCGRYLNKPKGVLFTVVQFS